MAMMTSCETPAMQGEDAASSLLEVMTATSSAQAARGRLQWDVSQWVHLIRRSLGHVASIIFSLMLSPSILAMVLQRPSCLCVLVEFLFLCLIESKVHDNVLRVELRERENLRI